MIGRTISRYRITEKLGEGGMGVVYKADDLDLKVPRALKFLRSGVAEQKSHLIRLEREARSAARLEHPGICPVHEIGRADGHTFIVMSFLDGRPLDEQLAADGPMDSVRALDLIAEVADALGFAHKAGIIHRDLKPSNIMMTSQGRPVLMDFGLAFESTRTQLTREGAVLGTLAYMSPEQTRGETLDSRSDVWSLGVILYELVSGVRPFIGPTDVSVIHAINQAEPPALPGFSGPLQDLLEGTLAKSPSNRFRDASAVHAAITSPNQQTRVLDARKASATPRVRAGIVSSIILILAVLAVVLDLGGVRTRWGRTPVAWEGSGDIRSLVVLPVTDLSGGAGTGLNWADAMTDELIAALQRQDDLARVISRRTAMRYRNSNLAPAAIARELEVEAAVDASIFVYGDSVRINVVLVDAGDGKEIWAAGFRRRLDNLMALQGDLSDDISRGIGLAIAVGERPLVGRVQDIDPESLKEYLLGLDTYSLGWPKDQKASLEYFHRAIGIEPDYGDAQAYLAMAYAWCWAHGYRDSVFVVRGRKAADRALKIAPDIAATHVGVGAQAFWFDGNLDSAKESYQRALELDPGAQNILVEAGVFFSFAGQTDKGLRFLRRAFELDPLNPVISRQLGWALYHARRNEEALEQHAETRRILERFPDPDEERSTTLQEFWNLLVLRRGPECRAMMAEYPDLGMTLADSCALYLAENDTAFVRNALEAETTGQDRIDVEFEALLRAHLGETEALFDLIARYHRERSPRLWWMMSDAEQPDAVLDSREWREWRRRLGMDG